jgi:murein DD-endopeptidase MepM/ murein hydrolase activator NlpD
MRRGFDLETTRGLLTTGALFGVLLVPLLWAARTGIDLLAARTAAAPGRDLPSPRPPAVQPTLSPPSSAPSARPLAPTAPAEERALTLVVPVRGVVRSRLVDTFDDPRGVRRHGALDIPAPRGTPVVAAAAGQIARLTQSHAGGLEIYALDASGRYCLYYAHLARYTIGLRAGQAVSSGQVLGRVGTSGNAPERAPHLHFAVLRNVSAGQCRGEAIDPLPLMR